MKRTVAAKLRRTEGRGKRRAAVRDARTGLSPAGGRAQQRAARAAERAQAGAPHEGNGAGTLRAADPTLAPSPVLLITDNPERYRVLARTTLRGRPLYLWVEDGAPQPPWSDALRGDPEAPATYQPLRGRGAIAVVDLASDARAAALSRVVCRALPQSAVVVIDRGHGERRVRTHGAIMRIDEAVLLGEAIGHVLKRAAARRRVRQLRRALHGAGRCTFLVQHDPDPDALASAVALRQALGFTPQRAPIASCGYVTRPENRRLITELGIQVRHVRTGDLVHLAPLVLVDVQPPYFGDALPDVAAVIDHHPSTAPYRAGYRDVRTSYGASATIAAEYLLSAGDEALTRPVATALLYGIITDTKSLSRPTSDADLQMFALLFTRADHAALRRIQHPSYSYRSLARFGRALERVRVREGLAYVHLGRLPESEEHIVAQLAEFCLGIDDAEISAVSGVFGRSVVMSTRALRPEAALGDRLLRAFGRYGSAGGHAVMAKAVIRLAAWRRDHRLTSDDGLARSIHRALAAALDADGERR
ncbi:MAG TPA: hypothetical protein VFK13_09495 [Gemmatimonadaceae bacterium]|nr:hypothetical protein [Gemmatimonadaceae bacterium]